MTVPIPPSYQNCTQEGNLPGCIVSDAKPDEQCNQGRTGNLSLIISAHNYLATYVTGFAKAVLKGTFCISRNINLKY